jgi:hypothetical protein
MISSKEVKLLAAGFELLIGNIGKYSGAFAPSAATRLDLLYPTAIGWETQV